MGRKLLIMPPYHPVEYEGDMGREIERRSEMYRDEEMRTGRRDDYRRTEPRMVGRDDYWRDEPRMGGRDEDYMRMGGYRYDGRRDMRMGNDRYYDERRDPYMGGYEPEMRRGRDSRGRYTSARMGGYNEPWMGDDDDMEMRTMPKRVYFPKMNRKIGFSIDGEMEHLPDEVNTDYRSTIDYPQMNEMEHRKGTKDMSGHASGTGDVPFTKEMAMEWTRNMRNPDGTVGPHWPLEKVKEVMAQKKLEGSPYEWYAVLNMVYSDYSGVAKKMNVNTMDFYVCMAKAFLDDPDAREDKLSRYYESVVM